MKRARLAVQIEQIAPDRRCRERTVAEQIRPVAIAQLGGVALERGEQVLGVARADAGRGEARAQRLGFGRPAASAGGPVSAASKRSSRAIFSAAVRSGVVGDVVGGADEGVERRDVRPQRRRQQPRAHREVLVARLPEGVSRAAAVPSNAAFAMTEFDALTMHVTLAARARRRYGDAR